MGMTLLPPTAWAQQVQQGVLFKRGTNIRLANAVVFNKSARYQVVTNNFGVFSILANSGDTLVLSHEGYAAQELVVSNFKDVILYLQPTANILSEVVIKGETVRQQLKEGEDSFRSKGIYYKGRPPLYLLLPFGGSPLTFFRELLSKDGKRARRFHRFAERESDYSEISARFNDHTIKRVVPIKDEELAQFKSLYQPPVELIRSGTDFELFMYIKKSYQELLKKTTE